MVSTTVIRMTLIALVDLTVRADGLDLPERGDESCDDGAPVSIANVTRRLSGESATTVVWNPQVTASMTGWAFIAAIPERVTPANHGIVLPFFISLKPGFVTDLWRPPMRAACTPWWRR